jgi:HKD family nuclease
VRIWLDTYGLKAEVNRVGSGLLIHIIADRYCNETSMDAHYRTLSRLAKFEILQDVSGLEHIYSASS